MRNTQIDLTGYIDVPEDRLEEITAALPDHIRLTRLEAGCVSFNVTPDPDHAGRFNVAEVFANRAGSAPNQANGHASPKAFPAAILYPKADDAHQSNPSRCRLDDRRDPVVFINGGGGAGCQYRAGYI